MHTYIIHYKKAVAKYNIRNDYTELNYTKGSCFIEWSPTSLKVCGSVNHADSETVQKWLFLICLLDLACILKGYDS